MDRDQDTLLYPIKFCVKNVLSSCVQPRGLRSCDQKQQEGFMPRGLQVHSTTKVTHSVPNIRKKYHRSTPETNAKQKGRLQARAQIPKESDPCPLTGGGLLLSTHFPRLGVPFRIIERGVSFLIPVFLLLLRPLFVPCQLRRAI